MKSPFSYVAAWNLIAKELHHSYSPMTLTNKIFKNSCPEEHLQTATFEGIIVTPNRKTGNNFYLIIY